MVHDLDFAWDEDWLRWQMDDVVLYEEPTDAHAKTAFRALSAPSTSLAGSSVSVDLSMNVHQSGKHPSSPPFFQIQSIDLKQNGSKDDEACRPRYPTDANCREKTCT